MNTLEIISLSMTDSQLTITIFYYLLYHIYNMINREMQIPGGASHPRSIAKGVLRKMTEPPRLPPLWGPRGLTRP